HPAVFAPLCQLPLTQRPRAANNSAMGEASQTGSGPSGIDVPADGPPLRLAAIDVGSNSIRLIIAEPDGEGGYRVLDDEKITARLGQGLGRSGRLDEQVLADSADTIHRMATIAR